MKRQWQTEELLDYWTLQPEEQELLVGKKADHNRLAFVLLLKFFQIAGYFPRRRQDIPKVVQDFVAQRLGLLSDILQDYDWLGRTARVYRNQIRKQLGFREATGEDKIHLKQWLIDSALPQEQEEDRLLLLLQEHLRTLRIESPALAQMKRLIHSAIHQYEQQFFHQIVTRLSPQCCQKLDELLENEDEAETQLEAKTVRTQGLHLLDLKRDPGRAGVNSILKEVNRLEKLRAITIPSYLFNSVSAKVLQRYRQRVATEKLSELRRHPATTRYALLAIFCTLRCQEITDNVIELLTQIVHRIDTRAQNRVVEELMSDLKRVSGKTRLLVQIAGAALTNPHGTVEAVIYPVVSEQTLRNLVQEAESEELYQERLQAKMRASYGLHYRRIIPRVLSVLEFGCNNQQHRPVMQALDLLKSTMGNPQRTYELDTTIPIAGVVQEDWQDAILTTNRQGNQCIDRISYEVCVLRTLREKLRCKEIWVEGGNRYRNPEQDLPQDFDEKRQAYYQALHQPLEAEQFIEQLQQQMTQALKLLDENILQNSKVTFLKKGNGWIKLSPLEPQTEPKHLESLKAEIKQRWSMTHLLDVLKETDLRVGFSHCFRSVGSRESLEPEVLQKRLLLSLYGLGTNMGLKRMAHSHPGETPNDLRYVRRKYIQRDLLRQAIQDVANATFRVRLPQIWGEATTACASDSKKFGAWDQNLLSEWHTRYGGRGVSIYWHVETKSVCIYSQLKRCSSSEAAAMIEGVLRHCTEMSVQKNYVDTHGQSEVAFAFSHLLGFQLLPRLKNIHKQKLYLPDKGQKPLYPNLKLILKQPIRWQRIRQQYDQLIKYATALKQGTANAEDILRRFTRNNAKHPTYLALAELGRAVKTMFLCRYLASESLRQEIQEGLNVVENWNSANSFIFYGKGGEIATNQWADQEITVLCLHLLQLSLVYINTLMIQQVLSEPEWIQRMQPEDLRGLTPLIYMHINPYGRFQLDLKERLELDLPSVEQAS
jgi:TnpA family transposase